jgi:hypothetical protein
VLAAKGLCAPSELDDRARTLAARAPGHDHRHGLEPSAVPPNAATRARDRAERAFAAGDWPALRALAAPGFVFDERRRNALVRGDVELWIANMQTMRATTPRIQRELLATAGECVALERVVLAGAPDGGAFEIEFLLLTEVDAEERLAASITYDLADRAAAFDELHAGSKSSARTADTD